MIYNEFMLEDVWRSRLKELDRIQQDLAKEKEPNKVFKSKNLVDGMTRSNTMTSIRDADTDEMLESVNKVYQYMLWYNIKNMQKSDPEDDQIKELQKMKDEALEEMFIQTKELPAEILEMTLQWLGVSP